jgi:NHL repeat
MLTQIPTPRIVTNVRVPLLLAIACAALLAACGDDDAPRIATATVTAAIPASATATIAASATATGVPTATPTLAFTPTVTVTSAPSATPTPSSSATPAATDTAAPTATAVADCATLGNICTIAGTGKAQFDGDGRPALQTSLYFPIDVLFDRSGRLLIMDWNNLRLRRVNDDGTVQTIMGTDIEDFPVEGGRAEDSPLHHASNMEYDVPGNLFIAGDHVPVAFKVDTNDRVFTVAGTTEYGYSGDGGPARQAELSTPFGVLPDPAGGLYISDVDAHVIRYVDPAGIIHTAAGTGEQGYAGDGGPATAARLAGPSRLQFGPDGQIYFCEIKNHVIRRLHTDGTIDTVAGTGERGYSGDGGPAVAAQLDTPYDIAFAPNGDMYVADTGNNVVRRIDTSGVITTVAGDGEPTFGGDGGPATTCSLRRPSALLLDPDGSLVIADTSNHRIRRIEGFLDAAPGRR